MNLCTLNGYSPFCGLGFRFTADEVAQEEGGDEI